MASTRRDFLRYSSAAGVLACGRPLGAAERQQVTFEELDRAAAAPVLRVESLTSPVTIESMELLRHDRTFLVRVRSKDGGEGVSVANASRLKDAYPIFLNRVAPFCVGKDARRWEDHLWELYRSQSNYKFQGLTLTFRLFIEQSSFLAFREFERRGLLLFL